MNADDVDKKQADLILSIKSAFICVPFFYNCGAATKILREKNMKKLKGKVAAVTGAGSGIGRALAANLVKSGCNVAISDVNEDTLQETKEIIGNSDVRVSTHVVDVANREQVSRYADEVVKQHGQVDVIINNAGVSVSNTFEDISYEDFEWVININLWGVIYGTKAFLPYLKMQPEGHIVNISSMNGMIPFPGSSPYATSKFAVRGFNKVLMQELRGSSIGITSVHPGIIRTNITRNSRFYKTTKPGKTHEDAIEIFDKVTMMSADRAARIIISGIRRNKKRLMVGFDARLVDLMARMFPVTTTKITGMFVTRVQ